MPLNRLVDSGVSLPPPDIQRTTFGIDGMARFICNTWDEVVAAQRGGEFDVVIIGSGMYGAYTAAKLFEMGRRMANETDAPRILVLESGPFLMTEHVQNLTRRSTGLGALVAARLRGAITIAIDLDERRLALAQAMGADYVINGQQENSKARVEAIKPGGADVVFEGTGIGANLDPAFALARLHGKFVFLGNYGNAPISFHFLVPHGKQLTAFFPCNDGLAPCRDAVLRNIATGAIPWQKTISHRVTAAEAPALYEAINKNAIPDLLGGVIRWS